VAGPVSGAAGPRMRSVTSTTHLGQVRDRVAARRGRNIGMVAARELTELVFYGLRDGRVRCLTPPAASDTANPAA
jgi:hypothetical protein